MLDTSTKRNIDDCRDILVGKLPDPKAQIEQITIGLIYKFMDDMDKQAIELGGKAKFFADYKIPDPEFPNDRKKDKVVPYSKYAWDKLHSAKVTAAEMLQLYAEAIEGMEKNPNVPQLFRDIFKNAYLPYRDPETLKLFLKTIDKFEYSHSEKLGDAFEYLLSVMGSQGDAGQFRTPRHIIDFIVAIINPSKSDTIMDPACGTAGFLISAFKHIKEKNKKGLTPDENKKLVKNFTGYDISPDMVRLSLVNLYLHGFADPHIHEYDTLTSEERWDESYDVILANPPFMSPKGGIRPHKRFSIGSNRSEVLFVDYIAEHINPVTGRAGVIVPEGIIFQSATAYKALRKMLVDNYLYAVVSLPAGVFNPYSGVKTSILLMDRAIAKKSNEILFVKIENDGYGLGAQRREHDKNDLPDALNLLTQYKEAVHKGKADTLQLLPNALLVNKDKIGENGEYNLSVDRYRLVGDAENNKWPITSLKDVVDYYRGITFAKKDQLDSERPDSLRVATTKAAQEWGIDESSLYYIPNKFLKDKNLLLRQNDILISIANSFELVGRVTLVPKLSYTLSFGAFVGLIRANEQKILPVFLHQILKSESAKKFFQANARTTTNISNLNFSIIGNFEFPLPPLSVQQEIVNKIEGWQKIIDGAKQVIDNYKPQIDIDPEWEMVELGEVCEIFGGGTPAKDNASFWKNGTVKWISSKYIDEEGVVTGYDLITNNAVENSSSKIAPKGSTILITRVSVGKSAFADDDYAINQDLTAIVANKKKLNQNYLFYCSKIFAKEVDKNAQGIGVRGVNRNFVSKLKIPLPALDVQKQIVEQLEKEQALVNANKELVAIFEQKIKDRIAKVWGHK